MKTTSINHVPALHKMVDGVPLTILDYGSGKYKTGMEYLRDKGHEVVGFDPFHFEHTDNDLYTLINYDIILCANVLNVVEDYEPIIIELKRLSKENSLDPSLTATVYISIYAGNGSSNGKVTTKGYQRNEKPKEYLHLLEKYFNLVVRKGNMFVCMGGLK